MAQPTVADDPFRKTLFKSVMKGDWPEVIRIYNQHPSIRGAKITRAGETALHIAVSNGQEEIVEELVNIIAVFKLTIEAADAFEQKIEAVDAFGVQDEHGETPLHAAAKLGSVKMCEGIAQKNPLLIGCRNKDGETPFFLAALNGHKEAFLCLHCICGDRGYKYCRRNNGDTILHCAISGDYFDLAFQIIHRYEYLVNYNNEAGFSPLHLLATKPSVFRSGSNLGLLSRFIYHCISVDRLKTIPHNGYASRYKLSNERKTIYAPPNYETCCNFIALLKATGKVVTGTATQRKYLTRDLQYPEATGTATQKEYQTRDPEYPEENQSSTGGHEHQLLPPNYGTFIELMKLVSKAVLIILGLGSNKIKKIREKKEKHTWSVQILEQLLQNASMYEYDDASITSLGVPVPAEIDRQLPETLTANVSDANRKDKNNGTNAEGSKRRGRKAKRRKNRENKENAAEITNKETPILTAAKNGITEIVEKILQQFPVAVHDMDLNKKNIVLLAVENRQPYVYKLLLKMNAIKERVCRKVDDKGNSALHLAARLGDHKPWSIPGAAFQIQWEIKWYEFVRNSMSPNFFARFNYDGESADEIFIRTHKELVKTGRQWLTESSQSCSVVATLIAAVAFATSATVPGGIKGESGKPNLGNQPAFILFAVSSLVALSLSVTSVIVFLSILTSRFRGRDFSKDFPTKFLIGLTSLLMALVSMLISFCAGHFFVLKDKLEHAALAVYAMVCLPVAYAIAQFPLYFDIVRAQLKIYFLLNRR